MTQLRIPGLSLKVTRRQKRAPDLATFRLGAIPSERFELDVDDEAIVQLQTADGEIMGSWHVQCDAVNFKRHRPGKGKPWLERIHTLTIGQAVGGFNEDGGELEHEHVVDLADRRRDRE